MICVQAVTWGVMVKDLNLRAIRGMRCKYKRKNLHITPGLLVVIYAVNKIYKKMGSFIIVKNVNMINVIIAVQNKILWLSKHLI
jgi:hypothetical protein